MKSVSSKLFNALVLAAITTLLWACGGGSSNTEQSNASDEFAAAQKEIASDIDAYIKDLPPPSEVPFLLMATGSDFNTALINSLDNSDRYTTNSDKAALNLGVYATDIGYLSSYDQTDAVYESVQVCQQLAEAIGVASAIDIDLLSRFEENVGNRDSLAILIDEVMAVTKDRLQTLDRINLAAVALSGSFVEGLYITMGVIDSNPDDLPENLRNKLLQPLVEIVIKQKKTLDDLIKVIGEVPQTEALGTMTTELNKLKTIYEEDLGDIEEKIANNDGSLQLNKELLTRLSAEVKRIRASIVE
ncbi:MAG: hypothetical protein R8G66_29330 [Cytophagales bacterium]|nr:hypothetical protein [Cytophagales bacterium]